MQLKPLAARLTMTSVALGIALAAPLASAAEIIIAPPAPRIEVRGIAPHPGWIWTDGYWDWVGRGYVWVPGRWVTPRRGYHWVGHRWVHDRHGWHLQRGHWER